MKDFKIKTLATTKIEAELEKIGFDSTYKAVARDKYFYKNIKIFDLTNAQVNILKQTALTVGADCATHREVITGNIQKSDAILGGSYSQISKIAEKLKLQPFSLGSLSNKLIEEIQPRKVKTKLVGIVNVTPDSFSDGGMYLEPNKAIKHIMQLIDDGANIIDIGAESTRPYSEETNLDEQIKRLKPILSELKDINIPISLDTRSSEVADFALNNGVSIINDVSGMEYDSKMIDVVSKYNAEIVIQHSKGTPQNMQNNPQYNDVVEEVYQKLLDKIESAKSKGISKIIVDIGIGFGKSKEDNFELLNRIDEFYSLNYPIMVGLSRKSFLEISDSNDNNLKDSLSLAISYPLIQKGVDYLRVHNVKLHKQLLNLAN
ncbi:MAG: dihydropteroate synthase [bacterium]|nr:dihydropteroate synthase [bacterium]